MLLGLASNFDELLLAGEIRSATDRSGSRRHTHLRSLPFSNKNASRLPARSSPAPIADRKSTRLNSSHGYISYAVFCLKKKKGRTHICNPVTNFYGVTSPAFY